jgi:hypothetical protein
MLLGVAEVRAKGLSASAGYRRQNRLIGVNLDAQNNI